VAFLHAAAMLLSSHKQGPMARHGRYFLPTSRCTWSSAVTIGARSFFGIENCEDYRNWLAEAAAEQALRIVVAVIPSAQPHAAGLLVDDGGEVLSIFGVGDRRICLTRRAYLIMSAALLE
jgi:hypothetical protein